MSQSLSKCMVTSRFSVLRYPNHILLAGMKNRNIIITPRFHAAPVQAIQDFFWYTDCTTVSTFLIYAQATRVPPPSAPICSLLVHDCFQLFSAYECILFIHHIGS